MVDSKQDYHLHSMTEVEGRTSMSFERALQTCDQDDFHITVRRHTRARTHARTHAHTHRYYVLYAVGQEDIF